MDLACGFHAGKSTNPCIALQEFCDINQLYTLLDNWAKSTGMSAVILDAEGNRTSDSFGMTEFCAMIHANEHGMASCVSTWKADYDGVYVCPMGFWDFSIPIALPDGQVLGSIKAGQALSVTQSAEEVLRRTVALGIPEATAWDVISRVNRKTQSEMEGAYQLLKDMVRFFVEKSYSIWKAKQELKNAPARQDRILSQITQIMYSYNLTVDLETDTYSLITGTGMERTVAEYKNHSQLGQLTQFHNNIIHPAYVNRFHTLLDFDAAKEDPAQNGFRGTLEYPVLYPGEDQYEWHEINVFLGTEEDGRRIANILGRDITKSHNAQEKSENELRAAAAKNQILSELTKMLYSYNLTLNLRTGKYSMIIGNGMTQFMEIFKSTDDYETAYNKKITYLDPENVVQFAALASLQSLRARSNANGFIGNLEYGAITDYGEEWHEINVFISTDETGEPIANILGRDITDAHKRQEQRENQQKAAMARDQLLSGITKMLYSYNLTINLETWKYTLITGTGMNKVLDTMQRGDDYVLLCAKLLRMVAPEDREALEHLVGIHALQERKNTSGFAGSISCRVALEDSSLWHEVNLFMGTNEDGIPVANILGRDITEAHEQQEAKERELLASAAKDQILSDITKTLYSYNATVNLNTGKYSLIVGTGMEGFIQQFSQTDDYEEACALLLANALPEYPDEMNRRFSLQSLRQQQNLRGHIGQMEYAAVTEKGVGWFEVNAFMGVDQDGIPTANILGREVTDIHQAQERRENELKAVAAKDQILSNITKTLYSYNLTLNLDSGKYSLIVGTGMEKFVKIFESTDDYEEAYHQKLRYVTPECVRAFDDFSSLSALRSRVGETGYIGNLEYAVKVDTGIEWHEINIFLGTDENGDPIANILGRDVTEAHDRADTKAQLEIANAANAAKSAFLFNMSHDIRTPMNAIIGFTELLDRHLDDPALARSYIRKIQTSSDFLLSLINNVLEMARIESGKETLDETQHNAYSFADSLCALFDSQMQEKGIAFTKSIQVIHPEIIVDETKLREIFLNILSNALKYTPAGGAVTMEIRELPCNHPGYGLYQTVIEDTGIGMSEDFLPHVFEEFSRERSSTESRVIGTGLGMPIVKKLVSLMHGTISVESQIGKGTKFTVVLPHRLPLKMDFSPVEKVETCDCPNHFAGKRILLAEDNDLNAEIAMTILEEAGFSVERAEDGIVCVDMLEKAPSGYYDLILMDIQMPNMDGYKATQTIRQFANRDKASITIVAMTANAFDEDRENAFRVGMNAHLAKPIRVEELLTTLTKILAQEPNRPNGS